MARPYLSIIIPTYNEAKRLPLMLIDLDYHLAKAEYSYEIIVVDDSSDATPEIVERFIPLIPNLKLIRNPERRGKGAATKIGMVSAKGNWCLAIDGDNSISIAEFGKVLPYISGHEGAYDIIVGSRAVKYAKVRNFPWSRKIIERGLNLWTRLIFRSKIKDLLIGFQCFSREAADKVFALTKTTGWTAGAEALLLGEKIGFKIKEIPIVAVHEPGSSFRTRDYLQILSETIKIRWWLTRGKYKL